MNSFPECIFLLASILGKLAMSATYKLDVVRDLPSEVGVGGRWRSVVAEVRDVVYDESPQVTLSSFVHIGCLHFNTSNALAALALCHAVDGANGSRIDCTGRCGALTAARVPAVSSSALIRGTECRCCTSDVALGMAARTARDHCNWTCDDQEKGLYNNSAFEDQMQNKMPWSCGGHAEHVYSAFRQYDGVSPLGRRGAFSVRYSTWYEVVVLDLPQTLRNATSQQQRWLPFSHFLHAVQVDLGWPVFAHQVALPFAPECLHVDGIRGRLIALARNIAGGLDVVAICPGCDDSTSTGEAVLDIILALEDDDSTGLTVVLPACVFDAERSLFEFVAVSKVYPTEPETTQLVEVDIVHRTVSYRSVAPLAKAISLDICKNRGSQHLSALLPRTGGEEFFVSSVDSLAGMGAHSLPWCSSSSSSSCASVGPPLDLVQMFASAAHASLPFLFYPNENGTGEGSTHLMQLRCDQSDQQASMWPSNAPSYHRRRSAPSEAPFNRRGGTGFPVQAPLLQKVEFLNSGRELVATFDGATLMGVKPRDTDGDGLPDIHNENETWPLEFSCVRLISAVVVERLKLQNSVCSWISPEKFTVYLDVDSQAAVGDEFYVRTGTVYSYIPGVGYSLPASGGTLLQAPPDVRSPEVIVLGPRIVDHCSDLELDASPSLYVAGRPVFSWRLLNISCESVCNSANIEKAIQFKNQTGAPSLLLEAVSRPPDLREITLEVGVESLWGLRGLRHIKIQFDIDSYRPIVFVQAVPSKTTPAAGALLKGSSEQSGCFSPPLTFHWRLVAIYGNPQNSSDEAAVALASRAYSLWDKSLSRGWNSSLLSIPSGALAAGVTYGFELSVYSLSAPASYIASAIANVTVSPAPLQILFVQPVVAIDASDSAQFDIAPSFDPDNPLEHFPSPTWACRSISLNACKSQLNDTLVVGPPWCVFTEIGSFDLAHVDWQSHGLMGVLACRLHPLALAIRSGAFDAGDIAQISAEVRTDIVKENEQWWVPPGLVNRHAEGIAQLTVLNSSSSRRLQSTFQNESLSAWVAPLHRLSIGSHKALRLAGYFGPRTNGTDSIGDNIKYRWVIERLEHNPKYNFEEAAFEGSSYDARVPRSIFLPVQNQNLLFTQASSQGTSLALQPHSLTPRAKYRFVLQVVDDFSSEVAMAAQEVLVVRSRPFAGHFQVAPPSGISSLTLFELSCSRWTVDDDALPLVYDFGYSPDFRSGNRIDIRLGLPSIGASLKTRHVANGLAFLTEVEFFVDVYTSLGAARRATSIVHIFPGIGSPSWILSEFTRIQQSDPLFVASRVPALLMQNVTLESTIVEGDSAYLWNLANESLLLWHTAYQQSSMRNVGAPPAWQPSYLGSILTALTQALRVIYRYLPKEAIRREGTEFLQLVLDAASPDPRLPLLSKVRPERFPLQTLHPSASITDALVRGAADLLLLPRISNFNVDGIGHATSIEIANTANIVTQLFTLLENLYALLTLSLAPDEAFVLDLEYLRFTCGRNVNLSKTAHEKASLEAGAPFDVLKPTPWLFVQAQLLPTIGRPDISWDFANRTNFTMQEELETSIALVAVGGLRDDELQNIVHRAEWVSAFGSYWRSFQEPPPAICFQWLSSGTWIREGVVADERGGCRVNLNGARSSAVVGLFPEPASLREDIASGISVLLEPPPEGGPARLAIAFGSLAALFALNTCSSFISRAVRGRLGAPNSSMHVAPPGWPLRIGFRIARVIDDHLFYGTEQAGYGVHWGRSFVRVATFSHMMLGLITSDHKVTLQQKALVLCSVLSAAAGGVAIFCVRLSFRPVFCAILAGILSWPLGLLTHFLYEYRLWMPPAEEVAETARDMVQSAQTSVSRVQQRVERFGHHTGKVRVTCAGGVKKISRVSPDDNIEDVNADIIEEHVVGTARIAWNAKPVGKAKKISRVLPDDGIEDKSTPVIKEHTNSTIPSAWSSRQASPRQARSNIVHQEHRGVEPGSLRISNLQVEQATPLAEEHAPMVSRLVRLPRPRSAPRRRIPLGTSAWRASRKSEVDDFENDLAGVVASAPSCSSSPNAQRGSHGLIGDTSQSRLLPGPPRIKPLQLELKDDRANRRSLMPRSANHLDAISGQAKQEENTCVFPANLLACIGEASITDIAHVLSRVSANSLQKLAKGLEATLAKPFCGEPLRFRANHANASLGISPMAQRRRVSREIWSDIVVDRSLGVGVLAPPLHPPQVVRKTFKECEDEVRDLANSLTMAMPFSAQRFIGDLNYDEHGLERVRKHLDAIKISHVRSLEHPIVEEVREDLPDSVASSTLWLAHTATFCITWAGCATMSVYSPYLFSSLTEAMQFLLQVVGSWLMLFLLDCLRIGLLTLIKLSQLEARRRMSQAAWSLKMEDFQDSQSQEGSSSERKSDSTRVDETVDAHDSLTPRTLPLRENDFLSVMPASVT